VRNRAWKRKRESKFIREIVSALLSKQSKKCYYCKCDISLNPTIDHLTPISRGAILTDVFNMVLSCDECNSAKGDLTEKEFLLFIEIHNRHPTSYERLQAYVARKIISWIRPIL